MEKGVDSNEIICVNEGTIKDNVTVKVEELTENLLW